MTTPSPPKDFLMESLGNYVLLLHISAGGMAELFLAVRLGPEGFERLAAIKRIHRHLALQRDFIDMFVQEAKVAALLSHPNIVHIYDLGNEGDTYYIAMEYVSGKDLGDVTRRWQEQGKVWPPEQAAFVISKVCAGLDYAHKKKDLKGNDLNLVHRDISPQNILLSYDGEVKLVDFGIAKAATQSTVTQTGVLKGKVAYMSPEQSWGSSLDRRSDIFSTGIVLYEMLTGRRLFKGDSDLNTLEQVRRCVVEPPTQVGVDIPADLEAVVLKALAREPAQRYQTAGHLQADLEKFLYDHRYSPTSYNLSMSMHSLFQGEIVEEGLKIRKAEQQIQLWRESRDSDLAATRVSTIVSPPPLQPPAPAPPSAPPVSAPPPSRPAAPPAAAKPPARTGLKVLFLVLGLLVFLGVAAAGGYLAYQWYGSKQAAGRGAGLPTPVSPQETETSPAPASPPASPGESAEAPPGQPRRIARGEKEPASPPSLPPQEETQPPASGAPPQPPPQYAFSFAGAGQSLLEDPVAMAADVSGNLFVLDHQQHKVIKFNARGEMLTSWGQKGGRQGEFNNPRGITVDHFGNVYVADTGNARVQKFNGFGVFSALVGGKDKTAFQEPVAVAADRNGHLFILDRKKAKIIKYSLGGDFLGEWSGEGEGMLKTPVKMAVGPQGFILIMDAGTNRIHKFNTQGEFLQALGPRKEGQLGRKRPIDITIDRMGRIYLLEAEGGRVFRFNPQGKLETFFGGKEEGVVQNPSAITVTPRGAVLVADRGSGKIHEFK